ncbi:MAG: DUF4372 domain-containing protein, partial [Phycisphaerae bacterium]
MNSGRFVLSQVLDLVDRKTLSRLVQHYDAESRVRHFGCRQQLICMAFAQLTWRKGLRDIAPCLNAKPTALCHLGFSDPVAKSTLADANKQQTGGSGRICPKPLCAKPGVFMAPERIFPNTATRDMNSRIHGCWLGKFIGGTLGLPAEGKMERLNFSFYNPVPTTVPPNDNLELQLVWLHLVENAGSTLTQGDFAKAWLDHIHYMWDEYGRTRWNLRRGVPVEAAGTFENPFHVGMGSPIRSEIWACLFPGDLDSAAHYAALDASLDHGTEGIAGEVLFAAMQS